MRTIKRGHAMPFGAELLDDNSVSFQLWAPAAKHVDLCLENAPAENSLTTVLPMTVKAQGWFALTTDLASSGSRYRFRINGHQRVPDPASRFQPDDVHGASEVINPASWHWQQPEWHGRPWHEAVIYELHVGSFTAQGNFAAVSEKLDYLVELGVTAIELMPIADFPGNHNWGYDGAYLFAPDSRYGRPDDLKALIDGAHARGIMVFLDVVYNHFGPEGNYLHLYAPRFFSNKHGTPWGAAINYENDQSKWVREFIIHNALYWIEEYHLDGLRLDAVQTIFDNSQPDILTELAERIHQTFSHKQHIHLMLENDHNTARSLIRNNNNQPQCYTAQWNDDLHHVLHVLLTGELSGYYMDYSEDPINHLGRCLAQGFAYQGELSAYRANQPRGEPSAHLPATAFVSFLQNHDQIGNRAFGERIGTLVSPEQLRAALSLLLLIPSPPLLFMGQEWNSHQPFLFFCDFEPELANKVVAGRKNDFAQLAEFNDPATLETIPDPRLSRTFENSVLDWKIRHKPEHKHWYELHQKLLNIRKTLLVPRLHNLIDKEKSWTRLSERALTARWLLDHETELILLANFSNQALGGITLPDNQILYTTHTELLSQEKPDYLPPWSVTWYLDY